MANWPIDPIVADTTYCTITDIEYEIGILDLTDNDVVSEALLNRYIENAQDDIDYQTQHAWREVTQTNEYHDFRPERINYGANRFPYTSYLNNCIHLNHRAIRDFDTAEGDKMEVWDGSQWTDWLAAGSGKTEGRGNDFWVDYTSGVVYFTSSGPYVIIKAVRFTYRYGETSVPGDIRTAATYFCCAKLVMIDDYSELFPDGMANIALESKREYWLKEYKSIVSKRMELMLRGR